MRDALDGKAIGATIGSARQLHDDLDAGKSRLIWVIDPDAQTIAIFGFQVVAGGFKVRHRDGVHIGSFANLDTALEAGIAATVRAVP